AVADRYDARSAESTPHARGAIRYGAPGPGSKRSGPECGPLPQDGPVADRLREHTHGAGSQPRAALPSRVVWYDPLWAVVPGGAAPGRGGLALCQCVLG